MRILRASTVTAFLMAAGVTLTAAAPADLETRRKAMKDLLADHWEYTLSHNPEFASILGDKRWNDRWTDFSQAEIEAGLAKTKEYLGRFESIDPTGFPDQEALTRTLLVRSFREQLEDARFKNWEIPVTQIYGVHIDAPQLVSLLSFETVKDYDEYVARLKALPTLMDQTVVQMRKGMAEELMPPKFLLEKVVTQAQGIADKKPEDSPFAVPLAKIPASFSEADKTRVREAILAAIRDVVAPAYVKFTKFVREEYAPRGRKEPGMWSLPQGAERYANVVQRQTTTNRTPDQIHQIGVEQVAQIEKDTTAVAKRLGFADWKALAASIQKDPKRHFHSREEILAAYRKFIDRMKPQLPKLFGRLPKADLVVLPVEEFREKEASGAQYNQGAPDGSRPGHVMVNTSEPESRKTISTESTAYHEGLPGHHLQIAIAQEVQGLPPQRQQAFYTAFVEGWGLYSERLGKEIGFYEDPYSDFGRLQDEMLRAIRLVVDTGFHAKKWTRQQVVDYFHAHSAIDEVDVQAETDRYISIPGQALAYKMGQLKIIELRERAKSKLGSSFDVRKFHDEVLDAGALPLDVLEVRVDAWIASQSRVTAAAN
ncbi:MAG: DUF885 domain-containing protein [Acidobacteria bacterium]|nr:MAG: DUF885 domain-containing protein [Acidobacteriota bacterium]